MRNIRLFAIGIKEHDRNWKKKKFKREDITILKRED